MEKDVVMYSSIFVKLISLTLTPFYLGSEEGKEEKAPGGGGLEKKWLTQLNSVRIPIVYTSQFSPCVSPLYNAIIALLIS